MKFITILFLLVSIISKGNILSTSINGSNVEIFIPNSNKHPLFLFIPGNGEVGNNRQLLYNNGPLKFIKEGWNPSFIVAGAQPLTPWAKWDFLNAVLTDLVARYNIDTTKIYLTGLSGGAYCIYSYINNMHRLRYKPMAVVPMSMNIEASCGSFLFGTDYLCGSDLNWRQLASWGLCGQSDAHYPRMNRFFNLLRSGGYNTKFTAYQGGHGGWNDYYSPAYKENGLNIYEWCLQFKPASLAVKWGQFIYKDGGVYWTTQSEENVSHFILEESEDGVNWSDASPKIYPNPQKYYFYIL